MKNRHPSPPVSIQESAGTNRNCFLHPYLREMEHALLQNQILAGTVGSGQAEKLSPMYGMLRESDLNVESETVRFA